MLHLRRLALLLSASLLLATLAAAQARPEEEGELDLTAVETYAASAPAGAASTLIAFQVAVEGRDLDGFDVAVGNAGALVSLILPNGTEVNALNAASLGFGFNVVSADSPAPSGGLFISLFSMGGTHTFIRLPTTAPPGTYQVKVNNSGVAAATPVIASYLTGSPIRAAVSTDAKSYQAGEPVVISAFLFNGTSPVTNAAVDVFVADQEHPEATPAHLTLLDSGPKDAEPGDGIYTGVYTAAAAGKFLAAIRASGTSPTGAPYARTASAAFRVLPPLAAFNTFADAGVDDNANGLIDRVTVTANLQVQLAGNYRLELTLAAPNGREARASAAGVLAAGVREMTASFTATQVTGLGVDGPYTIRNATLVHESDPEEPVAAFRENAGATAAYALSSLERPAIKFTGNNTVTGVDTNANGKFDLLRIQAEVNTLAAAGYNWSGTLKDASGKDIQSLDGSSNMAAGNNVITFDFDGIKIAQHGVGGPYVLGSVLVYNNDAAANASELLRTQAFSVNDFECSDAPAVAVQSVTLSPTAVVGGNATTLHVTLAQAAGACGAKVTIGSDNPALIAAALPATLIIPAGQTAADATIITAGVAAATQVNLTATSGGSSQSAALTISPSALGSLTLPAAVTAGVTAAGTVALDGAAPANGITVSLASGNPGVLTVPASVVIPAGERSAEVVFNTSPTVTGTSVVAVTAVAGAVTKTAGVTVFSEVYIGGSITPGGAPVTVTAAEPGQNFLLAFDGAAGQRVSLRMTEVTLGNTCCGAHVSIKKPDGSYLVTPEWVGDSGGFIDATTLPAAGTYTLVVDPYQGHTGSMTLTMYDVPPDVAESITPGGPPVTVNVTTPGQNARLTFAAAAGQRVSLNMTGVTIGFSRVYVYKPDGAQLAAFGGVGTGGEFGGVMPLPDAGAYVILVDPGGFNTGAMTLTLYDVPADVSGTIVPGGSPVAVTTTTPGQKASLSFAGAAGQRVSLKITGVALAGGNGRADVFLKRPDGTTLASATHVGAAGDFIDVQTLAAAGTYTVFVSPHGAGTGGLTLTLYDVPADVTGSITSGGAPLTVTASVPGQNALVSFGGTAGQRVTVNIGNSLTGGNGRADVFLRKPDGTTLASATHVGAGGGFINTQTLAAAGTYTILVNPQSFNTGGVTLTLNDVSADATGGVVVGGSSVTLATTSAGQNARLTFEGTAGQRVSATVSTTFGGCWYLSVYRPDGVALTSFNNCGGGAFVEPLTLPASGTYTVLVDPSGSATGSATVTLYEVVDLTGAVTVGGPAVPTTITTPGQVSRLTFDGAAGQRVSVNGTSNFSGCWYLNVYKPDGALLTGTYYCGSAIFVEPLTLPAAGTYTVRVDPSGAGTGTANVRVYEVTDTNGTAVVGGPAVSVPLGTPGQVGHLAFEGAAGQRVSVNSTSNFGGCWHLGVYRPDGVQLTNVFNCASGTFIEPLTLPVAGTYTVKVDPSGAMTGTASVRVYEVVDLTGTIEVGGDSVARTIATPGQVARLTFEGTAGQRLSVNSVSNFSSCWNLGVYKPDGTQLSNTFNCGSTFVEPQALPVSGTYTVLVDPSGAGTGTATVRLYDVVDLTGTLSVGGSTVGLTTTAPGQNARLTFEGTAGQQVTVRVTGSTYSCVRVTLLKPDNTSMTNTFNCGSGFNLSTQTLPAAGTYAVTVDPNGAGVGSVSVRVTSP